MSFFKSIFTTVALMSSLNVAADIVLSGSEDNNFALGLNSITSDLTGATQAPQQVFEYVFIEKDSVISRVEWMGSKIPLTNANAVFQISFHESQGDDSTSPTSGAPMLEPMASFVVEPEIIAGRDGVTDDACGFVAALDTELLLVGEKGYWVSIALLSAQSSTATTDTYAWQWTEANDVGTAYIFDLATGTLQASDSGMKYSLHGLYYTPPTVDTDGDGVVDQYDRCDDTDHLSEVDANGCAAAQRDSDNDGFSDDIDRCVITTPGEAIDASGCSASQKDSDNDGHVDAYDHCPETAPGATIDGRGCSEAQLQRPILTTLWEGMYAGEGGFSGTTSLSDPAFGGISYGRFYFLANTVVQRLSWVGSALPDSEAGLGYPFRISFHIAYPESGTIPWETPVASMDVMARGGDSFAAPIAEGPMDARVFTADLPFHPQLFRYSYYWVSVQYLGTDSAPTPWLWLANSRNCCAHIAPSPLDIATSREYSLLFSLSGQTLRP